MLPKALVLARAYSLWIQTCWRCFFVCTKYYKQVLGVVDIGIAGVYAFMWAQIFPHLQYFPSNITFCKKCNTDEMRSTYSLNGPVSQREMFWDEIVFLQRFLIWSPIAHLWGLIVLTENTFSLLVWFCSSKKQCDTGLPLF